MTDRIARRLKVLGASDERVVIPRKRFFTVGAAGLVEPYGEVLALLSHVDDDLGRYILATAPSASWGRLAPPPLVLTLPSRTIAKGDGVFLVTGHGRDRTEPHPTHGNLHLLHLGRSGRLWSAPAKPYLYRLDAMQT